MKASIRGRCSLGLKIVEDTENDGALRQFFDGSEDSQEALLDMFNAGLPILRQTNDKILWQSTG